MSNEIQLPPINTTTAVFHYLSPCNGTAQLDNTFTVRGVKSGLALSKWLNVLIAEHWCEEMDCTIQIFIHDTAGNFVQSEVNHCPR